MRDLFFAVFGILMLTTFISWLLFARFSMARIERQMLRDGVGRPASWDGFGLRVLWYASAISFPVGVFNQSDDPLIDVPKVRSYARQYDRLLGWVLMVSGLCFVISVFVGGPMLGLY
ncbi:hypothetical protein [Hydrocarboniclastica marina]|uniref:Uncharacterized protein n=1 Tax=Hydrocarboniclastica marina TaxID=2259620 RepID=A0A4P7XJ74_9ALTE|nr:hypothetical protein [Hydrocarboniclastica marina]QCF27146.1 hypothetical protein soil367_15060 [Hydrocarboniclastica marina]